MSKDLFSKITFSAKAIGTTLLVFFLSQIVVGIVIATLLGLMGNSSTQIEEKLENSNSMLLLLTFAVAAAVIFLIVRLLRWKKQPVFSFLTLDRKPQMKQIGQVFVVYGAYFVSLVMVTVVIGTFTSVNIEQQQELGLEQVRSSFELFQVFLMLAIIPPIYEEILFRGFLYRTLRKRLSIVIAGLLTCVLFGIAHLEYNNLNWIAAIDTFIFSAFLIYLVEKQKHLYGAMLLHALKNSLAFYVLFVR
ncbi:MAG TPA: type II CAAX endopeptidase family protein [Candidatus Saccharibacteria bacterium]|nr:type II CAAX endopeptidase family protein [Candidatus Saccharibacteria bacterium]